MKLLLHNKKIGFRYEILEKYTAGISLSGAEVKALKHKMGSLEGSFVSIKEDSGKYLVILRGLSIMPYQASNPNSEYGRERIRNLLLNKSEIRSIQNQLNTKGVTAVPMSVGLERGRVKVVIAVVRGKKIHDKRETIKRRDQERDVKREVKTKFS